MEDAGGGLKRANNAEDHVIEELRCMDQVWAQLQMAHPNVATLVVKNFGGEIDVWNSTGLT
jgi:hypothetical protein